MGGVPRSRRERAAVLPYPPADRLRELRLPPSLPSGRALLIGFALLGGVALTYLVARESSLFALRTFEINGAPPRVAAHVEQALQPARGRSFLAVYQGGDGQPRLSIPYLASP